MSARPYRSVLYIPGSKERALEKAKGLAADAIIFDLEDAVAPDEKPAARDLLVRRLPGLHCGARLRIVRINGLDTPWGRDDAQALAGIHLDAVLIPKVGTPDDVEAVLQRAADDSTRAYNEVVRRFAAEVEALKARMSADDNS